MARGRCTFRQQDVTRALRAAQAAGIDVERYEIEPDGKITVIAKSADMAEPMSPLDKWKREHAGTS